MTPPADRLAIAGATPAPGEDSIEFEQYTRDGRERRGLLPVEARVEDLGDHRRRVGRLGQPAEPGQPVELFRWFLPPAVVVNEGDRPIDVAERAQRSVGHDAFGELL